MSIIGDNNFSSFTNLKKELKVSTGTIYHHLDVLVGLIEQEKNKKYRLSDLGIYAYNSLKNNMKTITPVLTKKRREASPFFRKIVDYTAKILVPIGRKEKIYTSIISLAVLLIGTIFCVLNEFFSFLLFFFNGLQSGTYEFFFQILSTFSFIFNFLIYFAIVEVLCRFLYKKKENSLDLLRSFAIIFLPVLLYQIIHFFFMVFGLLEIIFFNFIDKTLLIFFQVVSLWILSRTLKLVKGLKIENGLIISLIVHIIGFSVVLFISL